MLPEVVHCPWSDPVFMPPMMPLFFSWIARFRKISIFLNMDIWGEHILPMHGWSIDMGPGFLCSVSSLPMEHILRLQGLQITIKISHRNFQNNPQIRKSIWQILETIHYFASTVDVILTFFSPSESSNRDLEKNKIFVAGIKFWDPRNFYEFRSSPIFCKCLKNSFRNSQNRRKMSYEGVRRCKIHLLGPENPKKRSHMISGRI